jgi:hypothetical protein
VEPVEAIEDGAEPVFTAYSPGGVNTMRYAWPSARRNSRRIASPLSWPMK